MGSHKIIITTTPNIEGYTIKHYFGIISAEIVLGTGFFTDMFSGVTDFFGLRSGSYESKLDNIQQEVINKLRLKAIRMKADAIVGLRVDNDEISGSGKSMLMVTAMGTAVKIVSNDSEILDGKQSSQSNFLTSSEMNDEIYKHNLLRLLSNGDQVLTDEIWQFITTNKIDEVAEYILPYFEDFAIKCKHELAYIQPLEIVVKQYFSSIDANITKAIFYKSLGMSPTVYKVILDCVKKFELLDFKKLCKVLDSTESLTINERALNLISANKNIYEVSDIDAIDCLINKIKTNIPQIAQFNEKAQMFSKSIKQIWNCPCGHINDRKDPYCNRCRKDVYGFALESINPVKAIQRLENIKSILMIKFQPQA